MRGPTSFSTKYHFLDTGRKLNIHKTFRRHPESLLKVLSTFSLRPVPRGHYVVTNFPEWHLNGTIVTKKFNINKTILYTKIEYRPTKARLTSDSPSCTKYRNSRLLPVRYLIRTKQHNNKKYAKTKFEWSCKIRYIPRQCETFIVCC